MKRRIQPGKLPEPNSLKEGRAIMRRIIEQWRNKPLSRLTVEEVGKYLFTLDRSEGLKQNFIGKQREMYREATGTGVIFPSPHSPCLRRSQRKGTSLRRKN
jgi:hypothetical protein